MPISRLFVVPFLLAAVLPAQVQLSFEGSTAGASIVAVPDAEGWTSQGGTVTVVPFGPIAGATSGFPTHQGQWCIIRSAGATGNVAAPSGGPAPYPFASGATGSISNLITVPVAAPGQSVLLSFDFTYVSRECLQSTTYNDWCSVDLVDTATGLSALNLLYRDTWSTQMVAGAVTPDETGTAPAGFCVAGALEEDVPGNAHAVSVVIPPSLQGAPLRLEAHVGDGGDASYNGYLYLDNVQIQGGTPPPPPMTSAVTDVAGGMFLYTVDAPVTAVTGTPYEIYTLVSLNPAVPTGSGPFLGMHLDAFMVNIFAQPLGAQPFHVLMTGPTYAWGPFGVGPGITVDWVTVAVAGGGIAEITPAQTKAF